MASFPGKGAQILLIIAFIATIYGISQARVEGNDDMSSRDNSSGMETDLQSGLSATEESDLHDQAPKKIRNIGYLFRGYNILEGDPVAKGKMDPGIRGEPIFTTTYKRKTLSSDDTTLMPDGTTVGNSQSCVLDFSSQTLSSEKAYEQSMKVGVEASGGYMGFSFKANVDYQKRTSQLRTGKSVYVRTESKCNVYSATLDQSLPPPLHNSFVVAVKRLLKVSQRKKLTDKKLKEFVERFGTHFIAAVDLGAKYGLEYEFKKDSIEKLTQEGLSVSVSAKYSGLFSAGVTASTSVQKKQREKFESASTDKFVYSYGSRIPKDGNGMSWAATAKLDPLPIAVEIKDIYTLFKKKYMKVMWKEYRKPLKALREEIKTFIQSRYCPMLKREGLVRDCKPVKETWTMLNDKPVCFEGKGKRPARLVLANNIRFSALKLVHISGKISCADHTAGTKSNWGCGTYEGIGKDGLDIVISTPEWAKRGKRSQYLFPIWKMVDRISRHANGLWYKMAGFDSNSPILIFRFIDPQSSYFLTKGTQLQVWYGEDSWDYYQSDNSGKVCIDVFAEIVS